MPPNLDAPDRIPILLEEYRQLYTLDLFRLSALDQRVPLICALLTGVTGSISVLSASVQLVALIALPLALFWLAKLTIRHALSLEDALRRIASIEREVNSTIGARALTFQSHHPGRKAIGGRTAREVIEAVFAAVAVLLAASMLLVEAEGNQPAAVQLAHAIVVALVAAKLLTDRRWVHRYRRRTKDRLE